MPDTGLRHSPKFQKGAREASHSLTPWNPFEVDQTQRGAQSPNVQPFDPKESFTLTLEIDATDALEDSDPAAVEAGIAGPLAALKKLTLPSEGRNGDQQEAGHRPAFIRRVRYVFEFPRPDAAERRKIWHQVIGELSGDEPLKRLEKTIEALAANVELSGAQIKNAVLASIFVARRSREPLAMMHLLRGIERELGKEGRSVGTRERERLMRDG